MLQTRENLSEQLKRFMPFRPCLCGGECPNLKVYKSDKPFSFVCPKCGFTAGPFADLQPAVTDWHRANLPNNEHTAEVWAMRYEKQMAELQELA